MKLILRIDNLWKSFATGVRGCSIRVWALRGCNLHVGLGERIAIVGAAGSGKSTLMRCISGGYQRDAGRIDLALPVQLLRTGEEHTTLLARRGLPPFLHLVDGDGDSSAPGALGTTAIVTSRDVASVRKRVDRIMLLRDGRLVPLTHIAVRRVAEPKPSNPTSSSGTHGSSSPGIVRRL